MFTDLPAAEPHRERFPPFEDRFARLTRGSPRIAYFHERPDDSTFRYRVLNMIEAIDADWREASAAYFSLDDAADLGRVANAADIAVICRARYGDATSHFLARLRRRGIPVLFDVDDLVFDTRYAHLVMNALDRRGDQDHEWDRWFAYLARIGAMLRLCDRAIATTDALARRIHDFSGLGVAVVPNFLNERQLRVSQAVVAAKRGSSHARDEHLHIGYFSGTPTHAKDFSLAASALVAVLKRFPAVRVRMVGHLELAGPLLDHRDRVERWEFRDYVSLQRLIGSTEINIAPLQDNIFTNCKSALKYFEAAAVGTVTVASPTHAFAQAIRDGDNGRLAAGHQWAETLTAVVDQLQDRPQDYVAMAERAIEDSAAQHSWHTQMPALKRALIGQ